MKPQRVTTARRLDPLRYRGNVSWSREPLTMEAWAYINPKSRDFYVAFVDAKGHTLCQGKFRVKTPDPARRVRD